MNCTKLRITSSKGFASTLAMIAGVLAMMLTSPTAASAGTPLGPDAQLFGVLADGSISLPYFSTISWVRRRRQRPRSARIRWLLEGRRLERVDGWVVT